MGKYYNASGEVGVLVSSGFGAGWSTWGGGTFSLFDETLVKMCLDGKSVSEVDEYLESRGVDFYTGGWSDCEVVWLEEGTKFRITEYDGSESLEKLHDLDYEIA